jgi:beta-lactamase class A
MMRTRGVAAIVALMALPGCLPQDQGAAQGSRQAEVTVALPARVPVPGPPRFAEEIATLGRAFPGVVGIAVQDVQNGWTASYNGSTPFPQQSVSKLWVALSLLNAVDRGAADLAEPVVVREADLTLFHQPIRYLIGPDGYHTTVGGLLTTALTRSDNTANDLLLRRVGGPKAVRALIADKDLGAIAFGDGERALQSRIAGLTWRPEFAIGSGFTDARAALPLATRTAALDQYLARPMDGAAPDAIVDSLARLHKGELLSPASTALMLGIMEKTKTGARRLRGGLAPGWTCAHKTGTGQELAGLATGYNDVGLITAPDGHSYAVAVMIGSTRQSNQARQQLMQDVVQAVAAWHARSGSDAPKAPSGQRT